MQIQTGSVLVSVRNKNVTKLNLIPLGNVHEAASKESNDHENLLIDIVDLVDLLIDKDYRST